jgi:predicted helicase
LGERNPKWLNDDYVKFIRFAQWRIEKTGYGVLAFVTNHGYLDNPTFRGMRQSLMKTFDDIYVLDLHGNSKKKEKCPNGSEDENVFDIQQGVSINIFVKHPNGNKEKATVHHADLWGDRDHKYNWLEQNNLTTTKWSTLQPQSCFYLFVLQNNDLRTEYEKGWKINDIMPVNSVGIVTGQDAKTIDITERATKELEIAHKINPNCIKPILYRPFDNRFIVYNSQVVTRPRKEVMQHMLAGKNLGLITCRQQSQLGEWSLSGVTNLIIESCAVSNKTKEINSLFPLYLYPDTQAEKTMGMENCPNFSPEFVSKLKFLFGCQPSPETIFYYIYAIFHSPTYRTRYAEFLKIDFPRVPLTSDDRLFRQLAAYGEELIALHLMKSPKLDSLITQYENRSGHQVVDPGHPKYQEGDVVINKKGDRFLGVPEEVWNFYVGGYQPCQKWLKDRKGRTLSDEDILHYQRIVVALQETIELMTKIDRAIPTFPLQ